MPISKPKRAQQQPRKCAFCRRPGVTDEHVWPQWMRKHVEAPLPTRSALYAGYQHVSPGVVRIMPDERRDSQGSALTLKSRSVCSRCNGGWMSTLEQRVEPLLVPLLKGEPRQLPLEDAALIAAWATKTAWMHLYMQKPAFGRAHSDFVTHEMLRGLMQSQLPTGNTHVWAAHHEGNSSLEIRAGEMLLSSSPDPRDPDEYTAAITTITVEKLNLVVFSAPTTRAVSPPLPSRKWHRLWPASGGLMWPTPESASDFDILMVASQHSDRYPLPPHRFLIREDLRPKPPRRY